MEGEHRINIIRGVITNEGGIVEHFKGGCFGMLFVASIFRQERRIQIRFKL